MSKIQPKVGMWVQIPKLTKRQSKLLRDVTVSKNYQITKVKKNSTIKEGLEVYIKDDVNKEHSFFMENYGELSNKSLILLDENQQPLTTEKQTVKKNILTPKVGMYIMSPDVDTKVNTKLLPNVYYKITEVTTSHKNVWIERDGKTNNDFCLLSMQCSHLKQGYQWQLFNKLPKGAITQETVKEESKPQITAQEMYIKELEKTANTLRRQLESIVNSKNKDIEHLENKLDEAYKEQEQMMISFKEGLKHHKYNLIQTLICTSTIKVQDIRVFTDILIRTLEREYKFESKDSEEN